MTRQFKIEPAVRTEVPLLIGLMGPSGGGKTFSALRLATGIQRIFPGDIIGIDTESNRMKHYADEFKFHHAPFVEPFGSLDYLEILKYAKEHTPSVIIIDSMSHEHEGPGGLLDLHEQELDRIAGDDWKKRDRVKMLAWARPKADRRKLINGLLQMNSNFIFCFRAKESSRPVKKDGKMTVENFGFMPIAGNEFVFEMTINMLLLPHADGHPAWQPENMGERQMIKLPSQFRSMFSSDVQLSEDIGEQLAKWAKGDDKPAVKLTPPAELKKLEGYLSAGQVPDIEVEIRGQKVRLKEKAEGAVKYLKSLKQEFHTGVSGYDDIQAIIGFIEKPEVEAPEPATEPQLAIF